VPHNPHIYEVSKMDCAADELEPYVGNSFAPDKRSVICCLHSKVRTANNIQALHAAVVSQTSG
jgi:hypothetical protein